MKKHFNFEEIFKFAWLKTQQHAWFLVCTAIIYSVILSAVKFAPLLEIIVALFTAVSLVSMSLIIVREESFSFADLFNKLKSPHLVLKFFALTIIYLIVVSFLMLPFVASGALFLSVFLMGGLTAINVKLEMLLLVTFLMFLYGLHLSICFKFYPYVLLENEHMQVIEVIKHTYKITHEVFWQLLLFFIMLSIINFVGFILLGLGLIVTIPVSILALAHFYRKLEGHIH